MINIVLLTSESGAKTLKFFFAKFQVIQGVCRAITIKYVSNLKVLVISHFKLSNSEGLCDFCPILRNILMLCSVIITYNPLSFDSSTNQWPYTTFDVVLFLLSSHGVSLYYMVHIVKYLIFPYLITHCKISTTPLLHLWIS